MKTTVRTILLAMLGASLLGASPSRVLAAQGPSVDLAGTWQVRLDPKQLGESQGWWAQPLSDSVKIPGSLVENGYGDDISVETPWTGLIVDRSWYTDAKYERYRQPSKVKAPFWLNPVKHYAGPAWYQRQVVVPEEFREKRIVLFLERPHWETRVWLDGRDIGTENSLSTPHQHELGVVEPGRHLLTIRVDNRVKIDVGVNAHSVTDHTQTNWNGIVGRVEMQAHDPVWIDDVQVYPDVAANKARARILVRNAAGAPAQGLLTLQVRPANGQPAQESAPRQAELAVDGRESRLDVDCPLDEPARLWDEFSPALYTMAVSLSAKAGERNLADRKEVTFGMREFKPAGTQFANNGRPVFLRGTLECAIFPLTGYPPTDVAAWTRILRIARAHGLNHLRFHSWCPPEAAFVAADRLGFMYQVECAVWTAVGVNPQTDEFLHAETERILRAYGNHPSFCLLSHGNEPGGKAAKFLAAWLNRWKASDPRRVYTSGSGWPILAESQYHVIPGPRIQAWGAGLKSRVNAQSPETTTDYRQFVAKYPDAPIVSHEIGQWCAYPNFDEIGKYTGVTRAHNFEIFRDSLRENHLADQARDFLMASGKLQTLLYKEEIESALRTPGFGGFQLLDLHDFPGQGTALVGVLDPFWDSKGYVTAAEYRRFAGETVPLARMAKRTWTTDESFAAQIEIAHFGPRSLRHVAPTWTVRGQDGTTVAQGKLERTTVFIGNGTSLGEVRLPLKHVRAPQKLLLTVALDGTPYANDWDFWVYPARVDTNPPADVLVADELSPAVVAALRSGAKVLWMPRPNTVKGDQYGKIPAGFSSIFWNTAWTKRQAPHTLGILCDPKHPALAAFPTDNHSNWQWWDLVTKSQPVILNDLPPQLRPIVQVIDDWFTNRRLGLVFEANVEGGRLLVCSIDLRSQAETRPVARQMLHSLLAYLRSDKFQPRTKISAREIRSLCEPASQP